LAKLKIAITFALSVRIGLIVYGFGVQKQDLWNWC